MEVSWPPFFMSKNGENSGWGYCWGYKVGLHFLKSGVTHSGFLGGRIEGEGKGWF